MNEVLLKIQIGSPQEEVVVCANAIMNGLIGKDKIQAQRAVVNKFLCTILNQNEVLLAHDINGAPMLVNHHQFISISHSKNWFAVQRSNQDRVGVDIQVIKHDISKGKHYFVNKREEELIELTPINLNIIWAAKEAAYKLLKGNVVRYKESMTVLKIEDESLLIEVNGEEVPFGVLLKEDFVLVYCI